MKELTQIYLEVALPIPIDKSFVYLLPPSYLQLDYTGFRVLVPFSNRILSGVVISQSEEIATDNYEIKEIIELLDSEASFSKEMISFFKWLANYYICSLGEVIKAAIPSGLAPQSIQRIEFIHLPDEKILNKLKNNAPRRFEILDCLSNAKGAVTISYLKQKLGFNPVSNQLAELEADGYVKLSSNLENRTKEKTIKGYYSIFTTIDISHNIIDTLEKKAPKQAKVLMYLISEKADADNPLSEKIISSELNFSVSASIKGLIAKGYVCSKEIVQSRSYSNQKDSLCEKDEILLELTEEQQIASNSITNALDKKDYETFLVKGVTGSGKTLVYMHSIKHVLKMGGSVILLVPEISLTPQLIDRFEKAFPKKVALMHSKMSDGERYDSWSELKKGEKRIVIGARSAIFVPIKNLQLIIVDEEHDSSYKQQSPSPRYNARDVAIYRAKNEGIVCVLGSATPSLETYYNANIEKYKLLEINMRADGAIMPKIDLVDIIEAKQNNQMINNLTVALLDAIIKAIQRKEGVILFLNRRGYAPIIECGSCGNVPECPHCAVSLTYHKHNNKLICHYCGYFEYLKTECQKCGAEELSIMGIGTQKIEEELQEYLQSVGLNPIISRIDLDTATAKGSFRKIFKAFAVGKIDILIGTQMIAKGLDFSRCSLVGVIDADLQLHITDFRSSERTFQLLTQVAGRAGRSSDIKGRVIIQSKQTHNQAILNAKNGDYSSFYKNEIEAREMAHYPPFSRFCVIEFSGKNQNEVHDVANVFFNNLAKSQSLMAYPPISPFISKIKNLYRMMIIIKSDKSIDKSGSSLRKMLKHTLQYFKKNSSNHVDIKIDIDSFNTI